MDEKQFEELKRQKKLHSLTDKQLDSLTEEQLNEAVTAYLKNATRDQLEQLMGGTESVYGEVYKDLIDRYSECFDHGSIPYQIARSGLEPERLNEIILDLYTYDCRVKDVQRRGGTPGEGIPWENIFSKALKNETEEALKQRFARGALLVQLHEMENKEYVAPTFKKLKAFILGGEHHKSFTTFMQQSKFFPTKKMEFSLCCMGKYQRAHRIPDQRQGRLFFPIGDTPIGDNAVYIMKEIAKYLIDFYKMEERVQWMQKSYDSFASKHSGSEVLTTYGTALKKSIDANQFFTKKSLIYLIAHNLFSNSVKETICTIYGEKPPWTDEKQKELEKKYRTSDVELLKSCIGKKMVGKTPKDRVESMFGNLSGSDRKKILKVRQIHKSICTILENHNEWTQKNQTELETLCPGKINVPLLTCCYGVQLKGKTPKELMKVMFLKLLESNRKEILSHASSFAGKSTTVCLAPLTPKYSVFPFRTQKHNHLSAILNYIAWQHYLHEIGYTGAKVKAYHLV